MRAIRALPPERGGKIPASRSPRLADPKTIPGLLAGCQVRLAKPIEPHELMATVASRTGNMLGTEA